MNNKRNLKDFDLTPYPKSGTHDRDYIDNRFWRETGLQMNICENFLLDIGEGSDKWGKDLNPSVGLYRQYRYQHKTVELTSIEVNIWYNNNVQTLFVSDDDMKDMQKFIDTIIMPIVIKMKSMCQHKNKRELSAKECSEQGIDHWGKFCHVYYCLDCGDIESVDSSG